MPLPIGTRVRYVKNECKLEFKNKKWFQAREKNIGNEGYVNSMFLPKNSMCKEMSHYFYRLKKGKNLYSVHFDKPVGDFIDYYCTREELEVI